MILTMIPKIPNSFEQKFIFFLKGGVHGWNISSEYFYIWYQVVEILGVVWNKNHQQSPHTHIS